MEFGDLCAHPLARWISTTRHGVVSGVRDRRGLVFQHGAGDGDEPVGDGSQGTGMAAGTVGGVFGTAGWGALHGDACPVVDGVAQAALCGEAAVADHAFARAAGDRSGAAQAVQGMVVSAPRRIEGFCEQRGEDDSATPGRKARIAMSRCPIISGLSSWFSM